MSDETDDEVDFTPKLNCGIWTAIENFINKENNGMIWDIRNVPPKVSATRKKERLRVRWAQSNQQNFNKEFIRIFSIFF